MPLIQDVKIRFKDGTEKTIQGVAKKEMKVIAPGMPVLMEFLSPLDISLGAVVLENGLFFEHTNHVAMTSQVDAETGMIKISGGSDDES